MPSDSKGYSLRLELRDEAGTVVGEISAKFSQQALQALVRGATSPGTGVRTTEPEPRTPPKPFRGRDDNPTTARGDERAMSTEQRKFLFRLAYSLGFKKDAAERKLLEALGVEKLEWATRAMASRGIDALKEELEHARGANGASQPSSDGRKGQSNGAHHG